jgi:hypothetical protein
MNFSNSISVLIFVKLGCPLILPHSFLSLEGNTDIIIPRVYAGHFSHQNGIFEQEYLLNPLPGILQNFGMFVFIRGLIG